MTPAPDLRTLPLLERAAERHGAGDRAGAGQLYQQVLALDPDQPTALAGLGALAGQQGQAARAAELLARACQLAPGDALAQHNHGEALRQLGQLAPAEAALRRALELDRHLVPAWDSLCALVQRAHDRAQAAGDLARAQTLAQELAQLLNNLGNAWLARGASTEAIQSYRRAIGVRGGSALAWSNLGNALHATGQPCEAEAACRQALALAPDLPQAWNNLGNALVEQARLDEAAACYDKALTLRPDFPEARHNRGSGSLFNRLYQAGPTYAEIAALHRKWGAALPPPPGRRWNNTRQPDRVLRVAYLSADFREHAMRHFLEPLLTQHDPARVEVLCYAQGPMADAHTRRLAGYGNRWIWVHGLDDAALARQIEADGIDILVDCQGHTQGTRITALAGKPAPIMLSWLGYLCTTGLPAMDYRLSDEWVDPPGAATPDTEQVLRLPGGMLAYRPHAAAPEPAAPPCLRRGQMTFGSLNNVQKLNRDLVAVWARLLHAIPGARLLLQSKLLADPGMVGRLRGLFEAFGIPPDRLDLRPARQDYLPTYHEIDIALDTFPYGGGATTCDALWMGVPVLSLAGERPAGRLSASLLQRIGHPEWVTASADAYVATALRMAQQPDALAALRTSLRAQVQASPLCDEAGFVRQLEACYRTVWRNWLEQTAG